MTNAMDNADRLAGIAGEIAAGGYADRALPGQCWFIGGDEVLSVPRDDGDSRYPYGSDGFNFWAYASGYMHSNEGFFSPFLRSSEGQEPKLAWFARFEDDAGVEVVPLLAVPEASGDAERFTVFHPSYVTYITQTHGLRFSIRVYIHGRTTRFTVGVKNLCEKEIGFCLASYTNPFLTHGVFEDGENRWFREVRGLTADGPLPDFLVRVYENLGRTRQVANYGVLTRRVTAAGGARAEEAAWTTSRARFTGGSRSSLHFPRGVVNGGFGNPAVQVTTFTEVGICGDLLPVRLPAGGELRIDSAFDFCVHCDDDACVQALLAARPDPAAFDADLAAMLAEEDGDGDFRLAFRGDGGASLRASCFNDFFSQLKKQVEFCATIKGYIQLSAGSLIGIRDVFQALEGYMIWQPEAARAKMLEALDFVDPSGRCPRQYALPIREGGAPAMDLRPFIDQGVWVISTIVNYLKYTGDFGFLNELCGYHEIVNETLRQVKKSEITDTVMDHMLRIMDWMLDKTDPKTGCIRVLFGDWNDALDGLGTSDVPGEAYGSGVSVMAAAQVWQNLEEMMSLMSLLNADKYSDTIADYSQRADRLAAGLQRYGVVYSADGKPRISHGWGNRREYYVGGWNDPDGAARRSLTSNAFWVLSGLYERDTGLHDVILEDILALDSKYGLKTFDPPFAPDAKGVGRIPRLPAGTAENGAAYVHASVFGVMALFRMGHAREAWELLYKALPMTHDNVSASPFVMPNSYGCNPEKNIDGQSMMDWQTGASNVVLKLLVRFVMGVEPGYDGVWIQPAAGCPYEGFEGSVRVKGARLHLVYNRTGTEGKRRFTVNGRSAEARFSECMGIDRLWIPAAELEDGMEIVITE